MPRRNKDRKYRGKQDVWRHEDVSEAEEQDAIPPDEDANVDDDDEHNQEEENEYEQHEDPPPTEPDEEEDDHNEVPLMETYDDAANELSTPPPMPNMAGSGRWLWMPSPEFQPMPPRQVCLAAAKPKWLPRKSHQVAWERFKANKMTPEQRLWYQRQLVNSGGKKKSLEQRMRIQRKIMMEFNQNQ